MRPSERAWLGLAAGVAAYDILCPKGETMSEKADEWLEHPTLRYVAIAGISITALHLMNLIPPELDPFARALAWKDRDNEQST